MCILAWHWDAKDQRLLLIGNRDEYYARPSVALDRWADAPIVAGRDLQAGGTWLGVGVAKGRLRMAAITNVRTAQASQVDAPSRGHLVRDFLISQANAHSYAKALAKRADIFNPFNLLLFDGLNLLGFESQAARAVVFQSGVNGVSNAAFNTNWPKLVYMRSQLAQCIQNNQTDDAALLGLLKDETIPSDDTLPNTGVGLRQERALAPIFIRLPHYGTRACTVLRLCMPGDQYRAQLSLLEQRFDTRGFVGESRFDWPVR